jgi:GTPase SAR1 family protein
LISQYAPSNVCRILVGNKDDLTSSKAVSYEQAKQLADEMDMLYFEVSAKTGQNVEAAFTALVSEMMNGKTGSKVTAHIY